MFKCEGSFIQYVIDAIGGQNISEIDEVVIDVFYEEFPDDFVNC